MIPLDFIAFWLAGFLSRTGGDPYDPAQWRAGLIDQTFLYPRPLAVLLEPLSLLPLQDAYLAWRILSILALAGALLMLLSLYSDSRHYYLTILAGAFLFRPFLATLATGQLSAFLLLDLAGVAWLWSKGRWTAGGALLSLLALKPQVGAPLLLFAGLWLLANRCWSALTGMVAGGLVLAALGWLADAFWVGKFLSAGSGKLVDSFGASPTLWGLSMWLSGFRLPLALALGGLAAAIGLLLVAWRMRCIDDPALALSGATALALLVTPYLWSYDQTLLILPIVVCTLGLRPRLPYLSGALLPLGMCGLAILFQLVAMRYQLDLINGFLGLAVMIAWSITPNP